MPATINDTILNFYDDYIPALGAGNYTIHFKHTLSVAPNPFEATQAFTVQGPQLTLPPGDILSVYPPSNATGHFSNDLPHLVMTKRVLPWERELSKVKRETPWMALLTFSENELLNGVNKETLSISVTAGSLSQAATNIVKPSITVEADIDPASQCNVIQVSGAVLKAILPNVQEAGLLAHVRQVSMTGKEGLDEKDSGWFSVVIGNRFPAPGTQAENTRNIMHLVSLEGWEGLLNDPSTIDTSKIYQLVSLNGWSFYCQADTGETFSDLAKNFVTGKDNTPDKTPLRLSYDLDKNKPAYQQVSDRITRGFVPLAYRTRQADTTFGWYRGPLAPQPVKLFAANSAFMSTSAATVFDQTNGIFDMSYAVAWQIGQAMALADKAFAQTVFRFRKKGNQLLDLIEERSNQNAAMPVAQLLQRSPHANSLLQFLQHTPQQAFSAFDTNPDKRALANRAQQLFANQAAKNVAATQGQPAAHTIRSLVDNAEVPAIVSDALQDDLSAMGSWLSDLHELRKVPFNHLVANTEMLPAESIRFFYVDNNWIELLVNGALSPGAHSTRDTAFISMMKGSIRAAINDALQQRWKAIAGKDIPPATGSDVFDVPVSGLLIRSAMVAGWPGLVIQAFQQGAMLKNIRMERLSPTVLLCLFLGVPDTVTISEPQHSLRFGVDDNGNTELRSLKAPVGSPLNKTIQVWNRVPNVVVDYMRKDHEGMDTRVVNISSTDRKQGLVTGLSTALGTDVTTFGAAAMAIQLVQAPEQLTFTIPNH